MLMYVRVDPFALFDALLCHNKHLVRSLPCKIESGDRTPALTAHFQLNLGDLSPLMSLLTALF